MDVASLSLAERVSLLSGSDVWHTQPLPDLRAVMLSDGPHGLRKQEEGGDHLGASGSNPATCFPTAVTLASSWDVDLMHAVGAALGTEARAEQIAVILGPGLSIKRHPNCGRNFEYMSEDPLLSGRMAAAMVRGIQSEGVGACLKHFAVNNQEAHRLVVDAVVDERTLREIYLTGFEIAVKDSQPWTVMAAYNSLNGTYCCDNGRLLTDILRHEWGFTGLVMSDWGATNDRVAGVRAGMDLEMPSSQGVSDSLVIDAVGDGTLSESAVNTSAGRLVALVQRCPDLAGPDPDLAAHHRLARAAAASSSVLLTNDGLLPLDDRDPALRSIALIGAFAKSPRYQGAGSSLVNPTQVDTAFKALQQRGGGNIRVTYSPGYDARTSESDSALVTQAVVAAQSADVVVLMVGLPGAYESEGFDRTDMSLPQQHETLIAEVCAANPRTVVALSNGSPVTMSWVEQPAAIIESYLGGQASGSALADLLFGDREPAGRLAETFPVRQADVPSDPFFPGEPRQVQYREALAVGYRYYATAGVPVSFPFGHGLSYTTFAFSDAALSQDSIEAGQDLDVSVTVTNTGPRPGSAVVQVYVHDGSAAAVRPEIELKGFAKAALEPGESRAVVIPLDERAFAFYDAGTHAWRTGTGPFEIRIGSSSADIHQTLTVIVHGDEPGRPSDDVARPSSLIAATDDEFAALLGHPIPKPAQARPFTRLTTVGELDGSLVGKPIRKGLHSFTRKQFEQMADGDAALVEKLGQALDEMPLRGVVLFADGKVTWSMLDALIDILNGKALSSASQAAMAAPSALLKWFKQFMR